MLPNLCRHILVEKTSEFCFTVEMKSGKKEALDDDLFHSLRIENLNLISLSG